VFEPSFVKPCVGSSRSNARGGAFARRERHCELVAAYAQGRVVFGELARHAERQLPDHERAARREVQVQHVDRHAVFVHDRVGAAHAHPLLGRVEVDREVHRRDLRLRLGSEVFVGLFVVDLCLLRVVRALVDVENVGVVEECSRRRRQTPRTRAAQRPRSARSREHAPAPSARAPGLRAACPHQVGRDEQQHRPCAPVRLEAAQAQHEVAVAVDVGVDRGRHVGRTCTGCARGRVAPRTATARSTRSSRSGRCTCG